MNLFDEAGSTTYAGSFQALFSASAKRTRKTSGQEMQRIWQSRGGKTFPFPVKKSGQAIQTSTKNRKIILMPDNNNRVSVTIADQTVADTNLLV
jgi:hypothetical protein